MASVRRIWEEFCSPAGHDKAAISQALGGVGGVPVQPSGALWDNVRESRAVIRRLGTEVVSNLCPI